MNLAMLNRLYPVRRRFARCQQGFTLIELLVVISILGLLATLVWPMILNQSAKAREARAINALGAMNRAQNMFFVTHNRFANSFNELGFASVGQDDNFHNYSIQVATDGVPVAKIVANPLDPSLKGYAALVYQTEHDQLSSKLCEGTTSQAPDPLVARVAGQVEVSGCNDV